MHWPSHNSPNMQKLESCLSPKEKMAPLPPIPSRNSLEEEEEEVLTTPNWQRVEVELEEMTLDDDGWSKWLRSSKPATPLPKIETFRAKSAMK